MNPLGIRWITLPRRGMGIAVEPNLGKLPPNADQVLCVPLVDVLALLEHGEEVARNTLQLVQARHEEWNVPG